MLFKYLINFFFIKHSTTKLTAWTYSLFTMKVGLSNLQLQKCATCSSRSAPSALWMQTEYGFGKCWVSPDWLSVRCCWSRPQSKKTLTGLSSNLSSSLCLYFLIPENWGTWCCSWGRLRSRGLKSSGCNRSGTQFSLRCAQLWRRSAGLLRWSRCSKNKPLLWSSLLPPKTSRRRTSTLFRWSCLLYNWLRAVWVLQECSRRGIWRGLSLHLKCRQPEFRWGQAA